MLNEAGREGIFINYKFEAFGDKSVIDINSNLIVNIQHKGTQLIHCKEEQKNVQAELCKMCSDKWVALSAILQKDSTKSFFYGIFMEKYYNAVRFGGVIPMLQELENFLNC